MRLTLVLMSCLQIDAAPPCLLIDTTALFSAAPLTCVNPKESSHTTSVIAICPSHYFLSRALPAFSSAFLKCSLMYRVIGHFFPPTHKLMLLLDCAQQWRTQQLESNYLGQGY